MIHAYLQNVHGDTIRPHGKEFKQKTNEINSALNLNIQLKHNFIKWFRCDGSCSHVARHFYGYVSGMDEKKLLNKNREVYKQHALKCGGTFRSINEPDEKTLSNLRRLKRNYKALIENEQEEKLCEVSGDKFNCKSCKWNENFIGRTPRVEENVQKMTRYSTDED